MPSTSDTVWFVAGSSGTADFSDGTELTGYRNLTAADLVNGDIYTYRAEHPSDKSIWENGSGAINTGTDVLARTTIAASSTGSKINFAVAPIVLLTPMKRDWDQVPTVAESDLVESVLRGNAGLEVWQRGTSVAVVAATTAYTADRWALKTGANQASTVTRSAGLTAQSTYSALVQRNNLQTGTAEMSFEYPLTADEILALRGRKATLSMVLKAGANWTPTSGNLTVVLYTGTGAACKRSAGFTGEVQDIIAAQAITTTTTRYSFTSAAVIGAAVTQASIVIYWTPVGTAGAADGFYIDDVTLVPGTSQQRFVPLPYSQDLTSCRRFLRFVAPEGAGIADTTTSAVFSVRHDGMYASPTLAATAACAITDVIAANFTQSSANVSATGSATADWGLAKFGNFTGLTSGRVHLWHDPTAGLLQLSSEL